MKINTKIVKIVVPILILVAIGAIWFIKNQGNEEAFVDQGPSSFQLTVVDMEEITSHGLPIMLDFGADACGPCRSMAPDLKQFYEEMQGKAVVHYTDVWKHPEAGEGYPIQVVPTQVFMNADGSAFLPSDALLESISGFQMYASNETGAHVYTTHQGILTLEQMHTILGEMGVEQ